MEAIMKRSENLVAASVLDFSLIGGSPLLAQNGDHWYGGLLVLNFVFAWLGAALMPFWPWSDKFPGRS